jgi:ParB family chromosome partitioning protein
VHSIRFRPKDAPLLSSDDALERTTTAAEKFNPEKITLVDLAKPGAAPGEAE